MAIKLFILGLPGSGKSTIFRHIDSYIKEQYNGCAISRFEDYTILDSMCNDEKDNDEKKRFLRLLHPYGFDILDFAVLDEALDKLAVNAKKQIEVAHESDIIVIEFSRDDYHKSFKQFEQSVPALLKGAYFLFLETDVGICKQRIHERVDHPKTDDDHYVSDSMFKTYYNTGNKRNLTSGLDIYDGIESHQVRIIVNNGLFADIHEKINRFIDSILGQTGNDKRAR